MVRLELPMWLRTLCLCRGRRTICLCALVFRHGAEWLLSFRSQEGRRERALWEDPGSVSLRDLEEG